MRGIPGQVDAFVTACGISSGIRLGGPMSLVVPYALGSMRSQPSPHLRPGTAGPFSIGLEAVQDLGGSAAVHAAALNLVGNALINRLKE